MFRIGTIANAVLIIMGWFINYFWTMTIGYESGKIDIVKRTRPKSVLVMGVLSGLSLMGSTSLLDTGKTNGNLHVFFAMNAFLWAIIANFHNTYIAYVLVKNHIKGMTKISLYCKQALAIITIVFIVMDV